MRAFLGSWKLRPTACPVGLHLGQGSPLHPLQPNGLLWVSFRLRISSLAFSDLHSATPIENSHGLLLTRCSLIIRQHHFEDQGGEWLRAAHNNIIHRKTIASNSTITEYFRVYHSKSILFNTHCSFFLGNAVIISRLFKGNNVSTVT